MTMPGIKAKRKQLVRKTLMRAKAQGERTAEQRQESPEEYAQTEVQQGISDVAARTGNTAKSTARIDLLWSDKVGYVFLTINEKTHQSESCEDLHTAPQLCHRLLDDMAITVLMQTKRNHNFSTMDKDEAAQVRAAWKPVIEKLPDYAYLCDEILREAQENEEENGIDLQ